jgi:hypothetical protein
MVREYLQSIARAERENLSYRRFLQQLAQFEISARVGKKVKRLLDQSKIPREFTPTALEQSRLQEKPRRQLPTRNRPAITHCFLGRVTCYTPPVYPRKNGINTTICSTHKVTTSATGSFLASNNRPTLTSSMVNGKST